MEFKRVKFLKNQMAQKFGQPPVDVTEQDIFAADALTLAYMGDVCWSLYIREHLIATGIYQVQILHTLAAEMVSAKWQARILYEIETLLNDRELKVAKRARNAHSSVPKSATVAEYRESTAFEALLGYLYLSGQSERLDFLLNRAIMVLAEEFRKQ